MKLIQKVTAVGLSALLLTSAALPALAAGGLEKDETVYVVLEDDGSVRSQTVSAHLHKEGGLSGVKDRSTLTNIENTQDNSGFTQNGEDLVWDTQSEDLYYKGNASRQAPVSAEITYALDGNEAPLSELLGQSGRITITIKLTNNETGAFTLDGKTYNVCTPFITMVGAVLGEGWENVEAPNGIVKSLANSQAAGFVVMPGVRTALNGLISDDLEEDVDSYLQDEVVLEADVTDLAAPSIFIVCGTDAEDLKEEGFTDLDVEGLDLDNLQEDMDALNDGMSELLDGASRLTDGAKELNSGALELLDGVAALVEGANKINDGAIALRDGAQALSSGAAEAQNGAQELQSGAGALAGGLNNLQAGAGAITQGYSQLKSGSESLSSGLNTLDGNSAAINAGAEQLSDGIATLAAAAGAEGQLTQGAAAFGTALDSAATAGEQAMGQLPNPETYGALLAAAGVPAEQQAQLLAAYTGAYQSATQMSGGLTQLNASYAELTGGVQQVAQGIQALQEGAAGLSTGLTAYTQGVASAKTGASQLDAGLAQLGAKLPELTGGVSQLVDGSNQLYAGAGALSQGNAALAEGAQQLAQGSAELAAGTAQLPQGGNALLDGTKALQEGTQQLADGAVDLQDGLNRYNDEGISKLTGSLDAEQVTTLKSVLDEMENRKEAYGSFSGTPEDAETTTRFILKTAEEPDAQEDVDSQEEEQPEEKSLWDRIKALFGK